MAVEAADGARGALTVDAEGRCWFHRDGTATAFRVLHDDMGLQTEDGVSRMLLRGLDGWFFQPALAGPLPDRLAVVLDHDDLASFYFPTDGTAPLLDHSPSVLGLRTLAPDDAAGLDAQDRTGA